MSWIANKLANQGGLNDLWSLDLEARQVLSPPEKLCATGFGVVGGCTLLPITGLQGT